MIGSITADILAAGSDIHWAIREAGQDMTVVWPAQGTGQWDDNGDEVFGSPQFQEVRALLMPTDSRRRNVAAGQRLPIPSYEAYVPFPDVDLNTPNWHLHYAGRNYYPTRDAQDIGGQGVCWLLELGSPGEVMQRG